MQNIILFGIDISLDNSLTSLGLLSVYQILDLKNIMIMGDMARSAALFSRKHFFKVKIHTHTHKMSFIHFESVPLSLKCHLLWDVKLNLLLMRHLQKKANEPHLRE